MDIGFIGLGNMGFHMARRLVEAGHQVTVFDLRREPMDRLVALGAQAASSVREVADRVETVMASLPTPDIVYAVAAGKGGLIEIVGYDLQPCGGTHVRSTAEIGGVRVTQIEKKGRQNRRVRIAFA